MTYRYGNCNQHRLLPSSIEEYVSADAPVRAYDTFVDALDFNKLGIKIEPHKVDCPQYNPPQEQIGIKKSSQTMYSFLYQT